MAQITWSYLKEGKQAMKWLIALIPQVWVVVFALFPGAHLGVFISTRTTPQNASQNLPIQS